MPLFHSKKKAIKFLDEPGLYDLGDKDDKYDDYQVVFFNRDESIWQLLK